MQADSGVWQPTVAAPSQKLAGAGECSSLCLKAGGSSAAVLIYDGTTLADAIPANLRWVLDASTTDCDNNFFPKSIIFKKGVFALCDQGAGNATVCIAMDKYTA